MINIKSIINNEETSREDELPVFDSFFLSQAQT